jgi:hypothetical protein
MPGPKESFRLPLSNGNNLSISIFPTRNDPKAEVISIEIRRQSSEGWVTDERLSLYRSPEGNYRQLPNREKPVGPMPV